MKLMSCSVALATALLLAAPASFALEADKSSSREPGRAQPRFAADRPTSAPKGDPRAEARKEPRTRRIDQGPREMEEVTFLGVETAPVSPTLIAQLALPDKAGLVVLQVVPGSGAVGALQPHDVLLRLDDQILIDQHQLSVLVRNRKEGDEITLTYVRGGKQGTARVRLTKRSVPKRADMLRHVLPPLHGNMRLPGMPRPEGDRERMDRVLSLLRTHPNAPVRMGLENRGRELRGLSIDTGKSTLVYGDDNGVLELIMNGGEKTLVAKDAKGEQQFSGPVSTPEQRKALPADIRDRLEKLESMQDVTFRTDGDFKGTETRVLHPGREQIIWRTQRSEDARSHGGAL